jgi:hypothetical protein
MRKGQVSAVDRIYAIVLEIKDITDTDRSASYLDLHLDIDNEGCLRKKLYDKRDDFNIPIVKSSFICSNISAAPAYGVYISQYNEFVILQYHGSILPVSSLNKEHDYYTCIVS